MNRDNAPYGSGPRWRTSTVLQMIRAARIDRMNGGVLPILADALEEDGYPDTDTLCDLRATPEMPPHTAAVVLARLEGGDVEASLDWLEAFAHQHLHGYEGDEISGRWTAADLIKALDATIAEGEPHYLGFDTPEETWSQRDEILRHYAAVTGNAAATDYGGALFSCSC